MDLVGRQRLAFLETKHLMLDITEGRRGLRRLHVEPKAVAVKQPLGRPRERYTDSLRGVGNRDAKPGR